MPLAAFQQDVVLPDGAVTTGCWRLSFQRQTLWSRGWGDMKTSPCPEIMPLPAGWWAWSIPRKTMLAVWNIAVDQHCNRPSFRRCCDTRAASCQNNPYPARRLVETVNLEDDAAGDLGEHQMVAGPAGTPVLEVEEVLRSADGWHFDAFRLAEVTQGRPLSTLTFWLMQQNGVVRDAGGACGRVDA